MTNRNPTARLLLLAVSLAIASLASLSEPLLAQTTSTWSGGAGNWSDCPPGGNALWNTCPDPPQGLGYPNGSFNAVINGGPVTATSASIVNLTIGSGSSLLFPASTAASLFITGTNIANNGSIVIDSLNGLTVQGPTSLTISGAGSISLANSNFTGASGTTSTVTLLQQLSGSGAFSLGMNLVNQNTINATGGTLEMQPSSIVNQGTFEASSGSVLVCCPGTPISFNNTGGTIEALNAGIVQLSGSTTFTGGTLTTTGSGVIQSSGNTILNALTNSGLLQASSTTVLEGTITNTGTIEVSSATLDMDGSTTVTGSGSIILSGTAQLGQYTGHDSLINQQLLEGAGQIFELPLTNQGTINADNKGNTLYLVDGATTNTSLMEASGGGILELETAVNNAGGTIEAETGSTVILGGNNTGTISGGVLTTSGTGVIESENGVLDGTVNIPTNAGKLNVNDFNLSFAGTINNTGTIALSNHACVDITEPSTLTGSGKLTLGLNTCIYGSGIPFTNQSTIEGSGSIGNSNPMPITNTGTILANSSSPLTIYSGTYGFTNAGKLKVNSGRTLNVEGVFNNLSGTGTLSGGTYDVSGTLGLPGSIVSNAANITLTGASAGISNNISSTNALTDLSSNATTGTLSLTNGQSLTTSMAFTNSGKITVGTGSSFTVNGSYTQTAGTTTVDGSITTGPAGLNLDKGSLFGKGSISAAVTLSGGSITAGDSSTKPGTLTINGSYTQQAKGALDISIEGTTAGTFGDLTVSNGVSLAGTLTIKVVNGFAPVVGDSFTILTGSAVSGTFATVKGTSINSSEHFEVNYTSTAVTLTVASGA